MNPIQAWNAFWFRPVSARPLAAFRIAFGVICLAQLALLMPDLDYWLTDRGLVQGDEARQIAGPLRPSPLLYLQDPTSVRVFMGASAVVAALFTIGWHTRVMSVLLYLAMLSIHNRNILTNCGPDSLLMILAFYTMLAPCGAAYSLDARRRARLRGTEAEPLIVPWAQRLIQLQICLVYFNTGLLKCNGATWLGGTAIHFAMNNPELGRFDLAWLSQYVLLVNVLTYGGLLAELVLPFLLWFRPTRPLAILAGVALHAGVLFLVNVPLFGEMTVAAYLTFMAPDELDRLLRACDPRRLRRVRSTGHLALPGRVDGPEDALRGPRHAPVALETADASA